MERSCVVCRTKRDKSELRRFVLIEAEIIEDTRMILPGRGAYICASLECCNGSKKGKVIDLQARNLRLQRAITRRR